MEKDDGRGVASFLSFPGLYDSPGGQEGSPGAACISDIKGQESKRLKKLDYYWNLVSKQAELTKKVKEKSRIKSHIRSLDFKKIWPDGYNEGYEYEVLNQELGKDARGKELLKIYSGVVLVRNIKSESVEKKSTINKGGGKKGKIKDFSKKSRLNMMKNLGMMKNRPEVMYEYTYADDVMEGLTFEERKLKSSEDMHQLKRWMEREGIKAHGVWKREWKLRKSGRLKDTPVPHFHNTHWVEDAGSEREYREINNRIADKWIEITGTKGEEREKAIKVIHHDKSFRMIKSVKQMRKYMQKYISKDEQFESGESIGRSWGLIGDPIEKEPEEAEIEHNEMVLLKRMLRKLCKGINKRVKFGLNFCLSHERTQFYVMMEMETVVRMLEHIRSGTLIEEVPF